jgi:AcrR family transcriptional regulator
MERRAAIVDETKRRILEASLMLHSQRGVTGTSWQEIADAAGVSVGTVYYHFPTMDDLVPACSGLGRQLRPAPTAEIFKGLSGKRARIDALVHALFTHYEKVRGPYGYTLVERRTVPVLARLADELLGHYRSLVKAALDPSADDETVAKVEALVDFRLWDSLQERGLSKEVMIATVADWVLHISNQG